MTRVLLVATIVGVILSSPAAADGQPPPLPPPAVRVDLARIVAEQTAIADATTIERGTPGDCDSYRTLALNAGWTETEWPTLRKIMWRESRCLPHVINRYGCVGLLQACRINHARLGVTRSDLQDAGTNLRIGRTLFEERRWKPWWTRTFRPR